ncbi:receptor-type tyrosine-protein phosphatase H [Syngnathus acus]|uniref:receptor-type tyrosine-protein phosphatase H n=1 Tax=Syngnathus acus TaxID=161584 RepID=UPI001885B9B6|nr:receptor-type tyrosine-protein phosphatase H [Syngnathus acus]
MAAFIKHLSCDYLLLFVALNLLWGASNSIETSTRHTTASSAKVPTLFTPTLPTPENVADVTAQDQNETSITLKWDKVNNISTYFLLYDLHGNAKEERVDPSPYQTYVTHVVAFLSAGRKYHFRIITEYLGVNSTGFVFSAPTAPEDVEHVHVVTQSESSITLSWSKVGESTTYILHYGNHSTHIRADGSAVNPKSTVTYEVPSLAAGTKYNFTLFAVFGNVTSTGFTFDKATVPLMVTTVHVTERSDTGVTLMWETTELNWSYLLCIDGKNLTVAPNGSSNVSRSFTLRPGSEYRFTLVTLFSGLASTAYKGFVVTAINCANVSWHVTTSSIQGTVVGSFTNATASNGSSSHASPEGHHVSFRDLYPGATYEVSLEYRKNSAHFLQCQLKLTTVPPDLTAQCEYRKSGYSVFIVWDKPDGLWTAVEVNVSGQTHRVQGMKERHIEIGGFQPARTYAVSLASLSGSARKSKAYVFQCPTDPRGVIAGSVISVLLFGALVGLAIFVLTKRRTSTRKKRSSSVGSGTVSTKKSNSRDVPLAAFPDHFYKLSMDKNRGFSEEYEGLAVIGLEHTQNAALVPENMEKNRFTNVLPYDWSRVKLQTTNGNSDYINASYMPGYNSSREYIATQGPLPSTVGDFWRMIWELRVNAIVMVTNCTEGRWTKCEHYWPAHNETCLHQGLMITTASEQQETNWTLREFRVKHKSSTEERTVKHFHFTAWPDHGVPQCTDVLIQFRGLIRRHMETNGSRTPTVVHCSAGVGRTGTIIALDVLLQQLHRDKEVGINTFVHNMRLRRPHMVQTESQYVFLHRCIMDCLESQGGTDESIYQNADLIYANATALREFSKTAV